MRKEKAVWSPSIQIAGKKDVSAKRIKLSNYLALAGEHEIFPMIDSMPIERITTSVGPIKLNPANNTSPNVEIDTKTAL